MRPLAAPFAFLLLASYLAWVFRLTDPSFWHMGLGDWMDPYFTNALMEHWYQSLVRLTDPVSPPMYYPVRGTLGYSHGLVLYVPFYAIVRPFLHPFPAQSLMLLLVIAVGAMSLFVVLRKHQRLSLIEAGLLAAFFVTSGNVTNGQTGVWLQRASVFLIPMVLLVLLEVLRMPDGRWKLALAWVAGLLATLLFSQDFQTAVFSVLLVFLAFAALLLIKRSPTHAVRRLWRGNRSWGARAALMIAFVAVIWTMLVVSTGGMTLRIGDVNVRSHDAWRPAVIGMMAIAALFWFHRQRSAKLLAVELGRWQIAFGLGALAGAAIFLWIYLPAFREHRAFPEQDLLNQLTNRDPASWRGPQDVLSAIAVYSSMRPFALVFVIAALVWFPPLRFDRETKRAAAAVILISVVVMLLPLRLNEFSIWRSFFWPIPGLAAIRDPSRVITEYELGLVLVTGVFLMRHRTRVHLRGLVAVMLASLMIVNWNRERLDYLRTTAEFDRWVAWPIDIDATCTSFVAMRGPEDYVTRPGDSRAFYGIESLFVALEHSIPTLNGYSAWYPAGWRLQFPEDADYLDSARKWVERHQLTGVCAFDVSSRTMRPFETRSIQSSIDNRGHNRHSASTFAND